MGMDAFAQAILFNIESESFQRGVTKDFDVC